MEFDRYGNRVCRPYGTFADSGTAARANATPEGRIEGSSALLLFIVEMLNIGLTSAHVERVKASTDEQTLAKWLSRVFDVATADEIFAD
jgi:hypothetical protein